MSDKGSDVIFLQIEDALIKCSKDDLLNNSDYFKAMLEGHFIENNQNQIKIEGVDLQSMNLILILLWDETYLICENDVFSVLQASCMLQFDRIKNICVRRIMEMLRLDNCIRIWSVTEQLSLKSIYLKAKLMALQEFMAVRDSDSLLSLNLDQILDYLGNIYLKTSSELFVFQTGMKWWYENSEYFIANYDDILLKLLSCLDFKNLDENEFNEIMIYPDISGDEILIKILKTVNKIKRNQEINEETGFISEKAQLLSNCKCRCSPSYAAILVNSCPLTSDVHNFSSSEEFHVIHYDRFKRKRVMFNLSKQENLMGVYYDEKLNRFNSLFTIDQNKCENLEGFKILGYKELIFFFGGQHLIGKGEWNQNFWVYDTIRQRWERKTKIPHCHRHFESCIVGNKVFFVGGIGNYRIIQDKVFFYDYKMDSWSNVRSLPQMKCCSFLNKCFFFSTTQKCVYFWEENNNNENLIKVEVLIEEEILKKQSEYALFSYNNKLYIKGKDLIELEMDNNKMVLRSIMALTELDCDKMEVTLCNDVVYTFYKFKNEEGLTKFSLETLNLQTKELNFIFKDLCENDQVGGSKDEKFLLNSQLKIFSVTHSSLVEENTVVNTAFRNIVNK